MIASIAGVDFNHQPGNHQSWQLRMLTNPALFRLK
jgi:hypothetical protein